MTPELKKPVTPSGVSALVDKIAQMTDEEFALFISLAEQELGLPHR